MYLVYLSLFPIYYIRFSSLPEEPEDLVRSSSPFVIHHSVANSLSLFISARKMFHMSMIPQFHVSMIPQFHMSIIPQFHMSMIRYFTWLCHINSHVTTLTLFIPQSTFAYLNLPFRNLSSTTCRIGVWRATIDEWLMRVMASPGPW